MDTLVGQKNNLEPLAPTLKKFSKDGSSGGSVTVEAVDVGSRGPSIIEGLGTASSSSNSLQGNTTHN